MLGTEVRISEDELTAKAKELAELLNGLPLPPLPSNHVSRTRPQDDAQDRRAGTRASA